MTFWRYSSAISGCNNGGGASAAASLAFSSSRLAAFAFNSSLTSLAGTPSGSRLAGGVVVLASVALGFDEPDSRGSAGQNDEGERRQALVVRRRVRAGRPVEEGRGEPHVAVRRHAVHALTEWRRRAESGSLEAVALVHCHRDRAPRNRSLRPAC